MIKGKQKWDYSISFVRMTAMIFIVTCHFFQYYQNELAFWFNVGVQMFFFISGLLHANREETNWFEGIKKSFLKLLVPYYILVTIACIFWFGFTSDANFIDLVNIFTLHSYGKFIGLHHLWFVAYILLAYIMTPLVNKILKCLEKSKTHMILGIIVVLIGGGYSSLNDLRHITILLG